MWVTSIAQHWLLALALDTMPWTLGRGVAARWCTSQPLELEHPVDPLAVDDDAVVAQPSGELAITVDRVGLNQEADALNQLRIGRSPGGCCQPRPARQASTGPRRGSDTRAVA